MTRHGLVSPVRRLVNFEGVESSFRHDCLSSRRPDPHAAILQQQDSQVGALQQLQVPLHRHALAVTEARPIQDADVRWQGSALSNRCFQQGSTSEAEVSCMYELRAKVPSTPGSLLHQASRCDGRLVGWPQLAPLSSRGSKSQPRWSSSKFSSTCSDSPRRRTHFYTKLLSDLTRCLQQLRVLVPALETAVSIVKLHMGASCSACSAIVCPRQLLLATTSLHKDLRHLCSGRRNPMKAPPFLLEPKFCTRNKAFESIGCMKVLHTFAELLERVYILPEALEISKRMTEFENSPSMESVLCAIHDLHQELLDTMSDGPWHNGDGCKVLGRDSRGQSRVTSKDNVEMTSTRERMASYENNLHKAACGIRKDSPARNPCYENALPSSGGGSPASQGRQDFDESQHKQFSKPPSPPESHRSLKFCSKQSARSCSKEDAGSDSGLCKLFMDDFRASPAASKLSSHISEDAGRGSPCGADAKHSPCLGPDAPAQNATIHPAFSCLTIKQLGEFYTEVIKEVEQYCECHDYGVGQDGTVTQICLMESCAWDHIGIPHEISGKEINCSFRGRLRPDMHLVVEREIKPRTKDVGCSYALLKNPSGLKIDTFITHAWGQDFREFVSTLQMALDLNEAIWIYSFALNQNVERPHASLQDLTLAPFALALREANKQFVALDEALTLPERAWCAYEIYKGYVSNVHISLWLSRSLRLDALLEKVQNLDITKTMATNEHDLEHIHASIAQDGGPAQVTSQVRNLLLDRLEFHRSMLIQAEFTAGEAHQSAKDEILHQQENLANMQRELEMQRTELTEMMRDARKNSNTELLQILGEEERRNQEKSRSVADYRSAADRALMAYMGEQIEMRDRDIKNKDRQIERINKEHNRVIEKMGISELQLQVKDQEISTLEEKLKILQEEADSHELMYEGQEALRKYIESRKRVKRATAEGED